VALGVVVVGVLGLALTAVLRETPRAFTLGVPASAPVAPLSPRQTVCQRPIDVAAGAAFDAVDARVGTYGRAGSRLLVTVRDMSGRVIARGRVGGGYPDIARQPVHRVRLDHSVSEPRISVCVWNAGPRRVALYGNNDLAARSSSAFRDGRPLRADITLDFERTPRSLAALVPRMLDRAALFRFPWLGAWAYVVLIVLVVGGGTWLLVRALASATAAGPVRPRDAARRPPPPRS
jgi:hypothetical protein